MSNIKKRLQKRTGIEYFDTAKILDKEIWDFIKHEFKNKSKKDNNEELSGGTPYRYWDTHAKPLHNYAWNVVRYARLAFQIPYPRNSEEVKDKKKYLFTAIGFCWNIHDALEMILVELPSVSDKKLDRIFDLLEKEISLLEGTKTKTRLKEQKKNNDNNIDSAVLT